MSLETQLEALNTNIVALIAAVKGAVGGAAATTTAAAAETKTAATGTKGKGAAAAKTKETPAGASVEEMQGALTKVKEQFSAADAKAIIESVGGVKKMQEIPADKVQAVFDAATKKLAGEDEGTGGDDDGL